MAIGKIRKVVKVEGASDLAKKLKISRQHLWFVRTGQRRSPRVERELAKYGIKVFANKNTKGDKTR